MKRYNKCKRCGKRFELPINDARTSTWRNRTYCDRCWKTAHGARPLDARVWAKVNKDGPVPTHNPDLGPCWLWIGSKDKQGYGRINIENVPMLAHRVVFFVVNGRWPKKYLLHHCDNPSCVNVDRHLYEGTPRDNSRDMVARGQHFTPFRRR